MTAGLARALYPISGIAALLLLWQVLVSLGAVPSFLLPLPARVADALVAAGRDGTLLQHLLPTLQATLLGYLAGCAAGLTLAVLVAESRMAERFLLLHLIAIQSIPKVAIAPLAFLWLGFNISGKILLVALICFPPIFSNALAGFRAVDRNLVDLMRVSGASRFHTLTRVKIPSAASGLFAGLEVSVSFALIGCVVMEFVGSTRGMGFLVQDSSNAYDLPLTFAAVVVLGAVGVLLNMAVRRVRRAVLFWERRDRSTT